MKRLSSRFHLALGLASLVVSLLLGALWLGLVPDREAALRAGRVTLAETLAMGVTTLLSEQAEEAEADPRVSRLLGFALRRNPALLSIGLRRDDGTLALAVGPHEAWQPLAAGAATDTQIEVPIAEGARAWGRAELRFEPLRSPLLRRAGVPPAFALIGAVALASFVLFYFYLQRMLRHLDPSSVVPGRVRTAFDTLAEGVVVVDAQGRIVLANRAFAEVIGGQASQLVGQPAAQLPWTNQAQARIHADEMPWAAALADARARHNVLMYLVDARGRRLAFMVNCSPVPGAGGKPAGVLVSFDDVTELEEKEIELRIARDEADAANRAKSDFLANMSHEIRTPMNAILGYTELLRRGWQQGTTDAQRWLEIIHGSGRHLLELINDILDLSKVEAGRLDVERIPCAVHGVVGDVVRAMQVKAQEKGVWLQVAYPEPLPASVLTDPARLRQIVTNLVGNGLKFTQQGGVTLTLRLRREADRTLVAIDIADTGIGIATDKLESIFEPFVQAEASTTRNFGGTGLGLAISRRFARALGGDVVASSVPGQGSTFHVTLEAGSVEGTPMLTPDQLEAAQAQPATVDDAAWKFQPAQVLVVDDGPENRQLVRLVLEAAGLQVVEAADGQQALDVLAAQPVDLVLMDVQMPVMDGYTATRTLRQRGLQLPVLALTANAMKGFEAQIAEAGFTAYLTKPVDIDGMLAELGRHLKGEQVQAAARPVGPLAVAQPMPAAAPALPAAAPAAPAVAEELAPIESRLANHPRLRRVVRGFALQLPAKLQLMRNALKAGDLQELAALAHWLKGAGGTVGFDVFFEPALALEEAARDGRAADLAAQLDGIDALAARLAIPEDNAAVTA
ncbi:hybrid sensor histidine kinase/response regulator [Aquincola tertiaricarbonis]|uniref:hybrid sensor histidine kinase/response regulator n=1 Tax=Aquincola tertiaricarbonis TaxID=391953 RepID=UPI00069600CF|nr:PAS domain-containing hybrid sensor histidine kinase/response regulator [Aquincola tertiaricarbonis]